MKYDFDTLPDRSGTQSLKWECLPANAPADTLPLWVADMDFPCAEPIIDALHQRVNRLIFGYSNYYCAGVRETVADWYARRFDWHIDTEHIVCSPGVVPAIMWLEPVERRRRETKNHPLCGCASEVIQKNTFPV